MPDPPSLCLITGANAGIGFEIARGVALTGAHVVLACRDPIKAEAARQKIPGAEVLLVDLASQRSIRSAAQEFTAKHDSLDVLINNAGVAVPTRRESPDGIELTFATNVLGYHLLTELLLGVLQRALSARIVNVASKFAYGLELEDVEFKRRPYDATAAYAQSKQADRMLTWFLARRLEGTRVTANAMSPGPVNTPLLNTLAPGFRGVSPAQGADTAIWLATSPELNGVTGRFWSDRSEQTCQFRSERNEQALASLCEEMCGLP